MRLAYVTETYPPEVNGVSLAAARTVCHLRARGHEVCLVRPRQRAESASGGKGSSDWRAPACGVPLLPELRLGISLPASLEARFLQTGCELVHVATAGPLAWAAVTAARRLALPVTSDFRSHLPEYTRRCGLGWLVPAMHAYLRRFHQRTLRSFVPTREALLELSEAGLKGLEIIGRGVDTQRFAPHRRCPELRARWSPAGGPVLLYAGRLAADSNARLALRAFQSARRFVPLTRMVVIGDGPLRKALMREFADACFVGAQRGEALARHYASADLCLQPALADALENVTLEALASGLPVVAYRTGAAARHVHDRASGRLIRLGDEDGFVIATCMSAWQYGDLGSMSRGARVAGLRADWSAMLGVFEQKLVAAMDAHQAGIAEVACVA